VKLSRAKSNGMNIVIGQSTDGSIYEIVSNCYPGTAYMNGHLGLKDEVERLLGFPVYSSWEDLVTAMGLK